MSDTEDQTEAHSDFEGLYLVKVPKSDMLFLNINRKSCIGSRIAKLDLTLTDIKMLSYNWF